MYQKEQSAWLALGRLMRSDMDSLALGSLDEVGAKRYGKAANASGQTVFDLQQVLGYIAPNVLPDPPDGAFGANTSHALQHVLKQTTFVALRDLRLLVPLLSKRVLIALEQSDKPLIGHPDPSGEPGPLGAFQPMEVDPLPEFFSQVDPRWKEEKMGVDLPFRRGGCGICCMAMLFNWMNLHVGSDEVINPKDVDGWMDSHTGYAPGTNLIIWKNMERFCADVLGGEVVYQQDGNKNAPLTHDQGMARAREYLTRRPQPIILRVQNRQFNGGNWFNHFVLGWSIKENGEIGIMDPRNMQGGELDNPQNNTAQTINKGGYNVVGIEQFILKELL